MKDFSSSWALELQLLCIVVGFFFFWKNGATFGEWERWEDRACCLAMVSLVNERLVARQWRVRCYHMRAASRDTFFLGLCALVIYFDDEIRARFSTEILIVLLREIENDNVIKCLLV